METRIDELDEGIFQLSTTGVGPRTVNVFVIDAEEPLLFHAGTSSMAGSVAAAFGRLMPLDRLRWLSFSHIEADEVGAMNQWLGRVPALTVLHSPFGCATSVADLAARPPVALADGGVVELGGRRVRLLATPGLPHNPEAVMLFEEVTATLCCSDVGSNDVVSPVTGELAPAIEPVDADGGAFPAVTTVSADTAPTLRRLARLRPRTLAVMHGASFRGDGAAVLARFADECEARIRQVADASPTDVRHR